MNFLRLLFIISILLSSCKGSYETEVIQITKEDALRAIETKIMSSYSALTVAEQGDTVYTLVSMRPEIAHGQFYFLARYKVDFYIFQKESLIYKNLSNQFYRGSVDSPDQFFLFNHQKKNLHHISLRDDSRVEILIKHHSKRELEDLISFDIPQATSIDILKESSLPLVEVNSLRSAISDVKYSYADLKFSSNKGQFTSRCKMKIRGSSSKSFPKKQFGLKTGDSQVFEGIQIKKNVLYSPYNDRSLIRNKLAYDLFSEMTGRDNNSTYCNLLVNENYEGIYLLLEHPKQQFKNHFDLKSEDSSFLVQINRCPCDIIHPSKDESYGTSKYIYEIPSKPDDVKKLEIKKEIKTFEEGLYSGDLVGIDLNAFIDLVIINELSKNIDAYRLSTYLAFDGKEMTVGPLWDFNLAWGMAEHSEGFEVEGFVIDGLNKTFGPNWWEALWENEVFQQALKNRYADYRSGILSNCTINNHIDKQITVLSADLDLNFEKWPLFGKTIWPNKYKIESYEEEISYMRDWINKRLVWLDQQWL